MIDPASTAYRILDPIADAVNPALTIAALLFIVREWRANGWKAALLLAAAMGLGIGGIYIVKAHHFGGEYSSHTAYATSLTASFVTRRKWVWLSLAVCLGYLALIVFVGYHTVIGVVTSAVAAIVVTLPWHLIEHFSRRGLSDRRTLP
ncbi:MAG TPA: hypothetical protein VG323_14205 [Thermoanaerobaculia bacterium]|nr:hypothetical protein [Thermoanaerobaculia bacterium]